MKALLQTPPLLLLGSACAFLFACRPQCDLIEVPTSHRDTLRYFTGASYQVCSVIMPADGRWSVNPDRSDFIYHNGNRRGVSNVGFNIHFRGDPGIGPYENNMHDYRGDSYFHIDLLTGKRSDVRFDKHICSSIGGWYGVFECDPQVEGDSIFVQSFVAKQEVPDRVMTLTIDGRYSNPKEKDELKDEVYRIIASTEWLSADTPRWQH